VSGLAPEFVLDHVGLHVRDIDASRRFYRAALEPLGFDVEMDFGTALGIGLPGRPQFWIRQGDRPQEGVHVAFHAPDRDRVDAFHAAALAAGGRDNGEPGLREHYHPTYYGAFVLDPDGNNVEAVCHAVESG